MDIARIHASVTPAADCHTSVCHRETQEIQTVAPAPVTYLSPGKRKLYGPERGIQHTRECKPDDDANVARPGVRDRPHVPRLRHAGDDDAAGAEEGERGGDAQRELSWVAVLCEVIPRPVVLAEDKVFCDDDRREDGAPVSDDTYRDS